MTYTTKDIHGLPVDVDTDHDHVTVRVGDRTAEFTPDEAMRIGRAFYNVGNDARAHQCGDCVRGA